jgi:hypothetical protein
MSEFSEIQDLVDGKLKETPDSDDRNKAINNALLNLWTELIKFNAEKYLSEKPGTLVNDDDPLPWDELEIDDYIVHRAAARLYGDRYEYDAQNEMNNEADDALVAIITIVIQTRDRQRYITPFTPNT